MGWADAPVIDEPLTQEGPAWMQAPIVDAEEGFGLPPSPGYAVQPGPPIQGVPLQPAQEVPLVPPPPVPQSGQSAPIPAVEQAQVPNVPWPTQHLPSVGMPSSDRYLAPRPNQTWEESLDEWALKQPAGVLLAHAKRVGAEDWPGLRAAYMKPVPAKEIAAQAKLARTTKQTKLQEALDKRAQDALGTMQRYASWMSEQFPVEKRQTRRMTEGLAPNEEEKAKELYDKFVEEYPEFEKWTSRKEFYNQISAYQDAQRAIDDSWGGTDYVAKAPPEQRKRILVAVGHLASQRRTRSQDGMGTRLLHAVGKGGRNLARTFDVASPDLGGLTDDQKLFRRNIEQTREAADPLLYKEGPWYQKAIKNAVLAAGEILPEYAGAGAASMMLAPEAVPLGVASVMKPGFFGKAANYAKSAAGTSAVFYPRMSEEATLDLLEIGMAPDAAAMWGRISGAVQAVIEVLELNPLHAGGARQAKQGLRKTIVRSITEFTKRYSKEMSEEGGQKFSDIMIQDLGKRLDLPEAEREGFLSAVGQGVKEMWNTAGPLGVLMLPGGAISLKQAIQTEKDFSRLDALPAKLTAKDGAVSRGDVKAIKRRWGLNLSGLELPERTAVMKKILEIEEEAQDAEASTPTVATSLKGGLDVGPSIPQVRANPLGDLIEVHPSLKQGYSSLDVPTKRSVKATVLDAIQDPDVFKSVVSSIPIDVMSDFIRQQGATEDLLGDQAMFINELRAAEDNPITARVIDEAVSLPALIRTEVARLGHTRGAVEVLATSIASDAIATGETGAAPTTESLREAVRLAGIGNQWIPTPFTGLRSIHTGIIPTIEGQVQPGKEGQRAPPIQRISQEVREGEGRPDLRGIGEEQVGEEPAGEIAPARPEEEVVGEEAAPVPPATAEGEEAFVPEGWELIPEEPIEPPPAAPPEGAAIDEAIARALDEVFGPETVTEEVPEALGAPLEAETPRPIKTAPEPPAAEEVPGKRPEPALQGMIEAVPAFKGATTEFDAASRSVTVTRQDGKTAKIRFDADAEVDRMAKKAGRKKAKGAYVYQTGKKGPFEEGTIYLRSDATAETLNHEAVHWLEDQGVVTAEEVAKYGGREALAKSYSEWAVDRKEPDTLFKRIYDVMDKLFSARRRLFEDIGKRGKAAAAPETPQDKAAATRAIKAEEREQGKEDAAKGILSREAIKYAPLDTLSEPVRLAMKQWAQGWLDALPPDSKRRPALEKIVKDAGADKGAAVENEKERLAKETQGYVRPIRRDRGRGEQGRGGYREKEDLRDPIGQALGLEPESRDAAIDKSVASIQEGQPDELALRMYDLMITEGDVPFASDAEAVEWLESLRDQPSREKQRTIFGTTEPTKQEARAEEPELGRTQGALFPKAGLPGQQNLFSDVGVPDSMVQRPAEEQLPVAKPVKPEEKETLKTRAAKRSERTSQELSAAAEELRQSLRPPLGAMPSQKREADTLRRQAKAAARFAKAAIDHGISKFAEYIALAAEQLGYDRTIRISDLLERTWNMLRRRKGFEHLDEAGKTADVLKKLPRPKMTGIKKEALARQHATMGMAPPNPAESVKAIDMVERAVANLTPESDEKIQERAAAVIADPRQPINLEEAADFLASVHYHRTKTNAAEDRYNELMAKGDTAAATAADADATTHKTAMHNAGQAARLMGSQWAYMGHIYQLLVDKDGKAYIERVLRKANQGLLEKGDSQWTEKWTDDITKVKKKLSTRGKEVEEKNAIKSADEKQKELENEVRRERTRPKKQRGTRNRIITKEAKDAAVQRIRDRIKASQQGTAYSLPVPQIAALLTDAAIVAGYHIEAGVRKLAEFSKAMVDDVGDWVKPHLDDLYRAARTEYATTRQEELRERLIDADNLHGQHRFVAELAKEILAETRKEDGSFIHREELLDRLHIELKKIEPDITRRETMDLLAGYGKYRELSKDDLDMAYRDRRGETRELSKIDDMLQQKPPRPSGQEQHPPSDEERQLRKKVRELKKAGERDGWYYSGGTAKKLKGTLDAQKTRLQNEIRDIDAQIADGKKTERDKRVPLTDTELEMLREIRNERKQVFDEVFGVPGLTDEQRAERYGRHLERQIENIREQLATGKVFPKAPAAPPTGPRITALKAELEALQAEKKLMRKVLDPNYETNKKTAQAERQAEHEVQRLEKEQAEGFKMKDKPGPLPETERLKKARAKLKVLREQRREALEDEYARKAAIAQKTRNIASIKDKLARGDFAKKRRPEPRVWDDPQWQKLKDEELTLRKDLAKKIADYEWKHTHWAAKGFHFARLAAVLHQSWLVGLDVGAMSIQAGIAMTSNPTAFFKAVVPSFRAMANAKTRARIDAEREAHPNYERYKKWGLGLTERGGPEITKEEMFPTEVVERLPIIAFSERHFSTFLNELRFRAMLLLEWAYSKPDGRQVNDKTGAALANLVNTFTGTWVPKSQRGKEILAGTRVALWAPSMYAARIRLLTGQPLYARGMDNRIRKLAVLQYVKAITGTLALYYLARFFWGDDDQEDILTDMPISTDWGKIKQGDVRVDVTAGLAPIVVSTTRGLTGKTKTPKGEIAETTLREQLGRSLGFKLKPWLQSILDLIDKEDALGRPVTLTSELVENIVPVSVQNAVESFEELGFVKGAPLAAVGVTGRNISIYDPAAPKSEETFLATTRRLVEQMTGMEPAGLSEEDLKRWLSGLQWNYDLSKAEKFLTPEQMKQVEERRKEKRRNVIAAATQAEPDRKKHKSDETYAASLKQRETAREILREMAEEVPYEQAEEQLRWYYAYQAGKNGKPQLLDGEPAGHYDYSTSRKGDTKPSFRARRDALKTLYGVK